MRKTGLDEAQAGIKTARKNINNLRYADDTTLMAEREEELKSLLMTVKEESEKLASSSTFRKRRSWHLVPSLHGKQMGKQWKQWLTLFLWAPKSLQMVTEAMKLKTLTPWDESYDQPRQHINKQRHYLANKGPSSQAYFPVVLYGCDSWTIEKAEH